MNKNTKQLQAHLRVARRRGERSVSLAVPVSNYHSASSGRGTFVNQEFNVSIKGKDGVVSASPRRNMQERVMTNSGGGNRSLTVHEPIDRNQPIQFPNHGYMRDEEQYRQLAGVR